MGQTDKAPSNPCYQLALSHADYEHDQVRVTPCYPGDTMNDGFHYRLAAALWCSKIAQLSDTCFKS